MRNRNHLQHLLRTLLIIAAMAFGMYAQAQDGNFAIIFTNGAPGSRTLASKGDNSLLQLTVYDYNNYQNNTNRLWHWEGDYLCNSAGLYIGFDGTNFIGVSSVADACEMEGYFDSNDNYMLKRKGVNAVMSYTQVGQGWNSSYYLVEDTDMANNDIIAFIERTGNEGPGGGTVVTPTIESLTSNAFYIRFSNRTNRNWNAYYVVTDNGAENALTMTLRGNNPTTDTDAAKNRLWTWVANKWLRNLQGNYIYLDGTTFKTTTDRTQATTFRIYYDDNARPKLRVLNSDSSDGDYVMRAETVHTANSAVIASTTLTATDDELELSDYTPVANQKYFIRFLHNGNDRYIHEMGCPGMADTYNGHDPVLCISRGDVRSGDNVNNLPSVSYPPNMRSMTWTLEQNGDGIYHIKSDNGLYMGPTFLLSSSYTGTNPVYSVVATDAEAGNFIFRIRESDHLMTLTDEGHPGNTFNVHNNKVPRYLISYSATSLADNTILDFVRNDDPLPQDVPTMEDGKWYVLKFAGVEQTLVKVHVDADGYYLFEHDKGRYICLTETGFGYTLDATNAAQFEVRPERSQTAERNGWHLECRNGDTPNVKVVVATGDSFSEVYHARNAANSGDANTVFSFEEAVVPDDIEAERPTMEDGGWYQLYFHDVPICARKVSYVGDDATGNRIYKLQYGTQYLKDDPTAENTTRNKFTTTTDPDEAARFTVTLGLGGWQLTRLTDDNDYYGGYTVAEKAVGNNRTITFREYLNKPTSYFGIERLTYKLEGGKKYVFYFDNMLLYGMYDLEMESGKDCDLLGNPANYGGMAWTALEPEFSEEDQEYYYRFQNEFGRYIAWNAQTKRYQVTSDASTASRFTLVEGDYGYMLQRLGTSSVFLPGSGITYGVCFTEKAILKSDGTSNLSDTEKHLAAIYFREVTSNDAWFDDSTEELEILHRPSFFQERANELGNGVFTREFLQPGTGMTERTLADGTTISTQDTPEYQLTRYVRQGDFVGLYLTTSKGTTATNHIAYQRLYLYDTDEPLTHKYFMPYNDNDAYLYKNGLVLGNALTNSNGTNLSKTTTAGARNHFVKLSVLGRLPTDEQQVTFACDFCYNKSADNYVNDLSYANGSATTAAEAGNLTEPTLSLRQIWTLIDAKVIADELVTKTGDDWLEERTIHFSNMTQGLVKEYVALNNDLENFWFYKNYTGDESQRTDENLVQVGQGAANADRYYVIETTDHGSGIIVDPTMPKLPQSTNIGDYIKESEYKRRRHISFSYPESRSVEAGTSIDIRVYAVDTDGNDNRYNIAKFTIIFDAGTETLPYMDIVGDEAVYPDRSPEALREHCGAPRAYLNFDYHRANGFISPTRSSMENVMAALPLDYSTTNYAFARRPGNTRIAAGWGSSAVGNLHKCALEGDIGHYEGNSKEFWLRSVSDYTGITYSDQYDPGFLFIDASDMPGQVATVSFEGDFCEGSLLMCSGWMSAVEGGFTDNGNPKTLHAPGSVVLTVMGRKYDTNGQILSEDVVYSFCPGQLPYYARRADGTVIYPEDNKKYSTNGDYIWQQFYFEFFSNGSDEYYLKIENNAIGTAGGDYMLDDIWIFATLPSFETSTQLPICGGEVELVRLENDFESLLNATGIKEWQEGEAEKTGYVGIAYLDWDKFVTDFKARVEAIDGTTYTKELFLTKLNGGEFLLADYSTAYQEVFQASLMRDMDDNIAYTNLQWSNNFKSATWHEEYTFAKFFNNRADRTKVYWAVEDDKRKLIFNGSMDIDGFEYYHNYMMLAALNTVPLTDSDRSHFYNFFNVISTCSTRTLLYMEPFIEVNGEVGVQDLNDVEHCLNTIETLALHVKAFRIDEETGELVEETAGSVAFDWWVGNKDIAATLENFKAQHYSDGTDEFTLQHALKCLRYNYPYATSLEGLSVPATNELYEDYTLTEKMLQYLKSLAEPADGSMPQLVLRSKTANVILDEQHLKLVEEDGEKYAYFCTMPIENDMDVGHENTYYTCSEPQQVKIHIDEVAPHIDLGFADKAYPDGLGLLSVRLAKKQFEQVNERNEGFTRLHIPIRSVAAQSEGAVGIIPPLDPELNVIYLTATTDTEMEDYLLAHYTEENGAVVGTMTYLYGTNGNTEELPEEALTLYFNSDFKVREGYSYTLKFPFTERFNGSAVSTRCMGEGAFIMKIVPDYEVWTGSAGNTDWNNDENWRRADYDELFAANGTTLTSYMKNGSNDADGNIVEPASNQDGTPNVNYITAHDRERRQGFAPLYCTNILMMTQETAPAPWLYDHGMLATGFPDLEDTSSPMLRYDFQGHTWPNDNDDANAKNPLVSGSNVRQEGDIVTELYTSNVCDKIAFQPETEIAHTELLTYDKAWVEFALSKNLWHLVGSPLKNTISGEWYAPSYSARQETTYYEPVEFKVADLGRIITLPEGSPTGVTSYKLGYDRFSPAVYQRAWDKAKAVLYERGAEWSADDSSQTEGLGDSGQGEWTSAGNGQEGYEWEQDLNADGYLNRLSYKPMGKSKVNVAIRGGWSGVYNDHTVPYDGGGFSVMPINHFKNTSDDGIGHNSDEVDCVFRLPKEDYFYDIWDWSKSYNLNRRVRVYIKDENRPWPDDARWRDSITTTNTVELNYRGRLRTDDLRPTTEQPSPTYTMTLKNEGNGSLGYFLACNPFICGLDMHKFFAANSDVLAPFYLVLKDSKIATDEELTGSDWSWTDVIINGTDNAGTFSGRQIVPARHAFFVRAKDGGNLNEVTVTFTTDMMDTVDRTPPTTPEPDPGTDPVRPYLSIRAQRDGFSSEARVELSPGASNTFLPEEDMETFVVSDITSSIPVVYTLTGRLATSINRLNHFNSLPLGIESGSNDPAILTFNGVESIGTDVQLYDALQKTIIPLKDGLQVRVPGATQNRYFLITGLADEAIAESSIQMMPDKGGVRVLSTSGEPISSILIYDIAGRLVMRSTPGLADCWLSLHRGVYAVKAATDNCQQLKKIIVE